MFQSFQRQNFCIVIIMTTLASITVTVSSSSNMCPQTNSNNFFSQRCCKDEDFSYKHLEKFMPQCSAISPKNESLTLPDCYWKLFECLLTEFLGEAKGGSSKETMENFGGIMAFNFSHSTKSNILKFFKKNDHTQKISSKDTSSSSDTQNLISLKKMWTKYFEAESKACQKDSPTDPPVTKCGPQNYPNIRIRPLLDEDKFEICRESLRQKFKNLNSDDTSCINDACLNIARGWMTLDDLLKGTMTYEKVVPKFWSKSILNYALSGGAKANHTLTAQEMKNVPNWGQNLTASSFEVQEEMKQFCTNGQWLRAGVRRLTMTVSEICQTPYRLL